MKYDTQSEKVEHQLKNLFNEQKIEPGNNTTSTALIHLNEGANVTLEKLAKNGFIVSELHESKKDNYKYRAFIHEANATTENVETECPCCGKKTTEQKTSLKRKRGLNP